MLNITNACSETITAQYQEYGVTFILYRTKTGITLCSGLG